MATEIRIKRRVTGLAGAPTTLKNGEVAFNEVDDTLYYGKGDSGTGGVATSVIPIAGNGKFLTTDTAQTVTGVKTFTASPIVPTPSADGEAATKGYVDTGLSGKLATNGTAAAATKLATSRTITLTGDATGSASFDGSANASITVTVADDSHDHTIANVDGLQTALDAKAPLASPALTGTPTAPTAAQTTNTTQIATTAFVKAAVAALVDTAPGALDTLNELAAALGDDPNFATTVTNNLAGKQPLDATLTALAGVTTAADRLIYATGVDTFSVTPITSFGRSLIDDASNTAARTTLGLKDMATQAANAVAITGGSITGVNLDGLVMDGGTF